MIGIQSRILRASAAGLSAAVLLNPSASAGDGRGIPVADLRFTVSDPLPPTGTTSNSFLPPSCLDANGLVAGKLSIGSDFPILWDSTTGVVHDLRDSVPGAVGYAKSVNARSRVGGYVLNHIRSYSWDASAMPIVSFGELTPYHHRLISLSDSNYMILSHVNAPSGPGQWSCIIDDEGIVHYNILEFAQVNPTDINDHGRMIYWEGVGLAGRMDPPYGPNPAIPLPFPTPAELGFTPTADAPRAINRYNEIVGDVYGAGVRLVRWNADDSYDVLDYVPADERRDIADNGIIISVVNSPFGIVLYDPDTLVKSTLDSLIEPSGNPLNFIFNGGGIVVGGIDSNGAVTRVLAFGFSTVLASPRWVVLTAVTPALTDGADFESGTLSPFDITGSGDAVIIDDPYERANHVLQMEGAVSISQPVSTPAESFAIGFRADVTALNNPNASVRVLLDETLIGEFNGGDLMSGALENQVAVVTDSNLMNRAEIPLKIEWTDPMRNGPMASVVLIDDIEFQEPPVICLADLTDSGGGGPDGVINVFDLFVLLSNWNSNGPGANLASPTDIVDVFDLFVLLGAWGPCE